MNLAALALLGAIASQQNIGIGSSVWTHTEDLSAASGCVTVGPGGSECKVFPAYIDSDWAVVIHNDDPDNPINCAWVGDAAATLTTTGSVSDTAVDGGQAGFGLPVQGNRMDDTPVAFTLMQADFPGAEDGFCSESFTQQNIEVFIPCRIAGGGNDCSSHAGRDLGVCITPSRRHWAKAGQILVCNGVVRVTLQRVKGL